MSESIGAKIVATFRAAGPVTRVFANQRLGERVWQCVADKVDQVLPHLLPGHRPAHTLAALINDWVEYHNDSAGYDTDSYDDQREVAADIAPHLLYLLPPILVAYNPDARSCTASLRQALAGIDTRSNSDLVAAEIHWAVLLHQPETAVAAADYPAAHARIVSFFN